MFCIFLRRYVHVLSRQYSGSGSSEQSSQAHQRLTFVRQKDTHLHTHTSSRTQEIPPRTRQVRWMHDIESVAVGAQQVRSSHPPSPAKKISRPIILYRHRLVPICILMLLRPFSCARVRWSSRTIAGTHNLERFCIKTTHRPRRPFHRAWCCFTIFNIQTSKPPTRPDTLLTSAGHGVFYDLTVFPYSCCCSHLIP